MDRLGTWSLAPAFDLTYSYDPFGQWTKHHQSWLNKKNNNFQFDDLLEFGKFCDLNNKKSREIIYQIKDAFSNFSVLAAEYELESDLRETVESNLRLDIG